MFIRKGLILLYHRVAELPTDPQLLCVTPQHFAEHLEVLGEYYRPMSLQQVAQGLSNASLLNRAVAVTFDDGYADNLYDAKPLLECYDIPATVFVAAGYIRQNREFWWDELERLLLQPGRLPERLSLTVQGKYHEWRLGEAAFYREAGFERHRRWHVEAIDDPTFRHTLYQTLYRLLRPLPAEERQQVLDSLMDWAGMQPTARPSHRALTPDEVIRLAGGGLVEVGAHTVTHPVLSALATEEQRSEIYSSKVRLEEMEGRPVTSFSYPYGSQSDYTAETVSIVQETGFTCACSNFGDVVWRGTDPFQLPRFLVRDWDGGEFARRLEAWFRD
jgi:peptidoglycan/xylan/chitin deacetylase (PgdA/CDA1 family)